MGLGLKSEYNGTFLTDRVVYRSGVMAADPAGPDGHDANGHPIPAIALHYDAETSVRREGGDGHTFQLAAHAYDAQLILAVLFSPAGAGCTVAPGLVSGVINPDVDDRCQALIRVWAWCGEGTPGADNLETVLTGFWCLYHEQSVLCDTLIPLRDIPATPYKVTVDMLSAGGSVSIIEQHST